MTAALQDHLPGGERLLDPFGASPRLAIEAAKTGRGVIVAVANPIARFILEQSCRPFAARDLQAVLARLAAAPKDGGRLEPFLLDLYATACSRCGATVSAEYFAWDRETKRPVRRAYTCPRCHHAGEEPTSEEDVRRALDWEGQGLHRALALEQVAPAGDPDRDHAEDALAVYPARAVYALVTLLNKLPQVDLSPSGLRAAEALLLSAFDAANALWGVPAGRERPLQLIAEPVFREANVWRAVERAVDEWLAPEPEVEVFAWDRRRPPGPRSIAVFPGPVRDLTGDLTGITVDAIATVLPRPNQAFWTLSALWAAWLWGRAAAAPVRAALRRRRYDWSWHAAALRASLQSLTGSLPEKTPVLGYVCEAEPGFTGAALAGMDVAGYSLTGRALRVDDAVAVLTWERSRGFSPEQPPAGWEQAMDRAVEEILRSRAEPTPYFVLHAAAWSELARRRWLAPVWREAEEHPMGRVVEALEAVLADRRRYARLDTRAEPETGLYTAAGSIFPEQPLSDRVELAVLALLREGESLSLPAIERAVCRTFPGLLTPDRGLIRTCIQSYGVEHDGAWRLRTEDRRDARRADREEIGSLLRGLGERLGFRVATNGDMRWIQPGGGTAFAFVILESATLAAVAREATPEWQVVVIPGGRGALVAEKVRRDPSLGERMGKGLTVVKYRHIRRLAEETTLKPEQLAERLALDPPERQDPQLPLL